MRKIIGLSVLIVSLLTCCNSHQKSGTEKIQKKRNNIINVSDKIVDIKSEIPFGSSLLYIFDDILIVDEKYPRGNKGIHLFNKNTFKYITSTGFIGRGPGEIINGGGIAIDRKNRVLWVPDFSNMVIYKFPVDSILSNEMFKPTEKVKLNDQYIIARFGLLNDTTLIGKAVHPTSNSTFEMAMMKQNVNSGSINKYGYENPYAIGKKSNSLFALSVENNLYVNCYNGCDLMTICDLEGNLKSNIYGPGWFDKNQDKNSYFFDVEIMGKQIIASYIGSEGIVVKGNIRKGALPSKLLIFDLDGNYLNTIEVSFEFNGFCIDEENRRIIAYFDDREEPLGYFDIEL